MINNIGCIFNTQIFQSSKISKSKRTLPVQQNLPSRQIFIPTNIYFGMNSTITIEKAAKQSGKLFDDLLQARYEAAKKQTPLCEDIISRIRKQFKNNNILLSQLPNPVAVDVQRLNSVYGEKLLGSSESLKSKEDFNNLYSLININKDILLSRTEKPKFNKQIYDLYEKTGYTEEADKYLGKVFSLTENEKKITVEQLNIQEKRFKNVQDKALKGDKVALDEQVEAVDLPYMARAVAKQFESNGKYSEAIKYYNKSAQYADQTCALIPRGAPFNEYSTRYPMVDGDIYLNSEIWPIGAESKAREEYLKRLLEKK